MLPEVNEQHLMRRYPAMIISFLLLFTANGLYGQNIEVLKESSQERYHTLTIFYLMAGLPYGQSAGDFFNIYGLHLGGKKNTFKTNPVVGLGLKMHFWGSLRIGLSVDYTASSFNEFFVAELKQPYAVTHTAQQKINVEMIPVLFSLEYIPYYRKQFKTYAGAGLGLDVSSFYWEEILSSSNPVDTRDGGKQYDEYIYSPAFRVLTGMELGFDKDPGEYLIGSLILELRYTFFYRQLDIFKNIKNEFTTIPEDLNRKFAIIPGYLSVNAAISFNVK